MSSETFDYSPEFQQKILALLVRDQQFLSTYGLDLIQPEHFEQFQHSEICRQIQKYFREHDHPPDRANLESSLTDYGKKLDWSPELFSEVKNEAEQLFRMELEDMEFVKDKVLQFTRRQELKKALAGIGEMVQKDEDLDEAITLIEKAVRVGHDINIGTSVESQYENLDSLYQDQYSTENVIETGFPGLDKYLMGGFFPGYLYVFVGKPGIGKTTLLSNLAFYAMVKGTSVIYYTFEVPEVEVMYKVVARGTGLTHDEIVRADGDMLERRLKKFQHFPKDMYVKHYVSDSASTHNLRSHISRLRGIEEFEPGMIVVDYADHMLPTEGGSKGGDNMYQNRGNIYSDLIGMAEEYQVPVVTASQPKVHAWDETTMRMEHLAESSKKAHLAGAVITMNQTDEEEMDNRMRLYIAKARKGLKHRTVEVETRLEHATIKPTTNKSS